MKESTCLDCWKRITICCSMERRCTECKEKLRVAAIQKQIAAKKKREKLIAEWKKKPFNIADIDPSYCRYCWQQKQYCICKEKAKKRESLLTK